MDRGWRMAFLRGSAGTAARGSRTLFVLQLLRRTPEGHILLLLLLLPKGISLAPGYSCG